MLDEQGRRQSIASQVLAAVGLSFGEIYGPPDSETVRRVKRRRREGAVPTFTARPSSAALRWFADALQSTPRVRHWLRRERGITAATAEELRVGWSESTRRLVIPAFVGDRLVQCYTYHPREKIRALAGWPRPLYVPKGRLAPSNIVVICEGELDAIVAWQHGFPAIARPGGKRWMAEWSELLHGRHIALVYDCDDVGRRMARHDASALTGSVGSVRVVELGLDDGEDVTDFFVKYRFGASSLRQMILRARRRTG